MTTAERAMARDLLEQVEASARIDPGALVRDVRERIIAQAEARKPEAEPWRYAITLMADAQLAEFRQSVESGSDPDEAATRVLSTAAFGDDDEPDAKPRRRAVKRLRSRRLKPAPQREPKQREPMTFGPAAFDQFGRIGHL
jgi:hypothetical protein